MIRLAGESDLDFLMAHDWHIGAQELARMISGAEVTETSLRNAEELLGQAESWKSQAGA